MVVVYGVGCFGKMFLKKCSEWGGTGIIVCDSNPNLFGTFVEGYEVHNFENVIQDYEIRLVVIATTNLYFDEIRNYVLSKIDVEVISYDKCVFINKNDNLNLGNILLKYKISEGIYSYNDIINSFDTNSFNEFDRFIYKENHNRVNKFIHYSEIYERHFSKFKGKDLKVLEIGVYGGGSLQMWKEYFSSPNNKVQIYGIDINPECKKYEEEGIEIFIGSQEDRNFLKNVKEQVGMFDIIIDDGGHTMNQQICSFEELFGALSSNGVYLCEDVHTSYWDQWGGGYKKEGTFIEYSKNLIDDINEQYIDDNEYINKKMTDIKSVNFYDSIVVIEKRNPVNRSIHLVME